ncbi:protein FAM124B-like [Carlito syrichta]|uniref:Protein FAM124B-like n=1 Tax=Carlito syrichta TaxID=1868482 RepID=A0A3Q0DRH0_CARSF|nr:protein FAM124B-like [Carlito syrichta]
MAACLSADGRRLTAGRTSRSQERWQRSQQIFPEGASRTEVVDCLRPGWCNVLPAAVAVATAAVAAVSALQWLSRPLQCPSGGNGRAGILSTVSALEWVSDAGRSWVPVLRCGSGHAYLGGDFQVQLNPGLGVRNGISGADMMPQGSRLTSVSAKRTLETRSRRSQSWRSQVHSLELPGPSGSPTSDSCSGTSWKSPGWSSHASRPAMDDQLYLPSPYPEPGTRMKVHSQENSFQKLEAETNVDTGFTIINSEPRQPLLSRFPRDLHTSQLPSCLPDSSSGLATSKNNRVLKERVYPLSFAGQERELGARKIISKCPFRLQVQGEEKEEEFFI